jgi:glycosyltransferase involved in cell wall biosynthesis
MYRGGEGFLLAEGSQRRQGCVNPIRILHVITGLSTGGAELMLLKLLSRIDRTAFEPSVVSLTGRGVVAERIEDLGIKVEVLGLRRDVPNPLRLISLAYRIAKQRVDAVQTWMYHADLVGGLAAKLAGSVPVVWGIRRGRFNFAEDRMMTQTVAAVCARLSAWLPTRIVCCSGSARESHEAAGYDGSKMVIIPNGFEPEIFRPDREARRSVREELHLHDDAVLIGLVARFDPQKDHLTFLEAAGRLLSVDSDVRFVLCGEGISWDNQTLAGWVRAFGVEKAIRLVGRRDDIPRLTAALDIASLSSIGEGFPNVVGEAMACGVPCVVTDVGDTAHLVGKTGIVVPPRDPSALAAAWKALLDAGADHRRVLGMAARERILTEFNLPDIVKRYENLYREIV